jgi:hypothetical protein
MGRVSISNSGSFSSGNANGFFSLADDKDSAVVTFLYEDQHGEDIDYFVVHEAEVDGRRRYVNCNAIGEDEESIHPENCPLCEEGYPRVEKLFLQLYNENTDQVETWDRGRSYVSKIVTLINKYGPLVGQPFEIVRNGKKGDQRTTYEFFPEESEADATLDDFPEKSELLGTLILDLDDEQMWDVVDGKFTLDDNSRGRSNSRSSGPAPRRGSSLDSGSSRRDSRPAVSRRGAATGSGPRTRGGRF